MKIRNKIAAAALLGIFPFLIGMNIIVTVGRVSDRAKTADLMAEYTQGVATGLEAFFSEARFTARHLAFLHGETMLDWADRSEFFEEFVSMSVTVSTIAFVDSSGNWYQAGMGANQWQVGRAGQDGPAPAVESFDFFRDLVTNNTRALPLLVVNEPIVPPGLTEKSFVTSAAVIHNGRSEGVINAVQNSWELSRRYSTLTGNFRERFGTGAHMYLVSDGGQLVSWLEYNAERDAYVDSLYGTSEIVSVNVLGQETLSVIQQALGSNIGRSNTEAITASINGEPCFVSGLRIDGTPFSVCLAVPANYVLSASRTMVVAGVAIFIIIAAVMTAGMIIVTKSMLKSLNAMDAAMREIAEGGGDLAARLEERGNDEISIICKNFNQFIQTLNVMVSRVIGSASSMDLISDTLSGNVSEIARRVSAITKDIDNMNLTAEEQSASVTETSSTITQITQNIESLSSQIESQSTAVTESSAAVQQMVSNINSISANLARASESFMQLKGNADDGKESISNVQELVNKLTAQSDSLLEANSIIDTIASQTNLLAMNAAIEAAHAGDAGRGFAVVAEEIRNLAENASEQSKAIDRVLKEAVKYIKNIANAADIADSSFDSVVSMIDSVTALVSEINFSMSEQSAGSRQVLEGLTDIENVTMQIRDGAVEMNAGTATVLQEMSRLHNVSEQVKERSLSISNAAAAINSAVEEIVQNSGSNRDAIEMLVSITSRFKL